MGKETDIAISGNVFLGIYRKELHQKKEQ